jgi:hypothetical protein
MVSLRRCKLKAIRAGCNVKKVNLCKSHVEVEKLLKAAYQKTIYTVPGAENINLEDSEDGAGE